MHAGFDARVLQKSQELEREKASREMAESLKVSVAKSALACMPNAACGAVLVLPPECCFVKALRVWDDRSIVYVIVRIWVPCRVCLFSLVVRGCAILSSATPMFSSPAAKH